MNFSLCVLQDDQSTPWSSMKKNKWKTTWEAHISAGYRTTPWIQEKPTVRKQREKPTLMGQ